MNKIATAFILVVMTLGATSVGAQKFGYVDTEVIVAELPQVKEANTNIETLKNQLTKKGQEMIQDLQTKYQDLQTKQNEISPKLLNEETEKLKQMEADIATFEKESQAKVYAKSQELLAPIQEKINTAIKAVASEMGYQYIFDLRAGNILYADEATNVSKLVAEKLKSL